MNSKRILEHKDDKTIPNKIRKITEITSSPNHTPLSLDMWTKVFSFMSLPSIIKIVTTCSTLLRAKSQYCSLLYQELLLFLDDERKDSLLLVDHPSLVIQYFISVELKDFSQFVVDLVNQTCKFAKILGLVNEESTSSFFDKHIHIYNQKPHFNIPFFTKPTIIRGASPPPPTVSSSLCPLPPLSYPEKPVLNPCVISSPEQPVVNPKISSANPNGQQRFVHLIGLLESFIFYSPLSENISQHLVLGNKHVAFELMVRVIKESKIKDDYPFHFWIKWICNDLLASQNSDRQLLLQLQSIDHFLSRKKENAMLVEELEGLDKIEMLQNHPNQDVYEEVVNLLETYFTAEEEVDEAELYSNNFTFSIIQKS